MAAAENGHIEIVQLLLSQKKIKIDLQTIAFIANIQKCEFLYCKLETFTKFQFTFEPYFNLASLNKLLSPFFWNCVLFCLRKWKSRICQTPISSKGD